MSDTFTAKAYIKGVASAPRKTKIVADLVRDRLVEDALVILEYTPRRAAKAITKAIASAKANLMKQHDRLDQKTIRITRLSVTAGTRSRRYMPASRGRALPFEKITSNIFVEVAGEDKPATKSTKSTEKSVVNFTTPTATTSAKKSAKETN